MYPRSVQFAGMAMLAVCTTAYAQQWTEEALLTLFNQSPIHREAQFATAAAVEFMRGKTLWPNPITAYSRETVGFTDLRSDLALALAHDRNERTVLASHLPVDTTLDTLCGDFAPQGVSGLKDDIMRRALDSCAEIRAESSRLIQLAFRQKAAKRLRIPKPMITASIKRTQVLHNRIDTGAVISVSIPLPVFNKGQTEVARLTAEQLQSQARRDLMSQQLTALVAGAYDVYIARLESLNTFNRETPDIGRELLEIVRVGYEEGELGILQVLDACRIDRKTNLRRLELQASVKEIEIELSRNAGYEVTQ